MARPLEPGVLVGGVIDNQLDHHLQTAIVGLLQKLLEVRNGPVTGVHVQIVGDVVAIVPQRRRKERQQP